jgi:hypothetical protein
MFSSNTTQTSGGYQISRSLRFNSADSAYLNRTPASAGNRKTWTFSTWVKRSQLSSGNAMLATVSGSAFNYFSFGTSSGDWLTFAYFDGTSDIFGVNTSSTSVFRDVSAWYHIVLLVDTTQATAANRVKIYVNNVEQTLGGTYPTQNYDTPINNTISNLIGGGTGSYTAYLADQYMTEINFIDGQALTPSSFGETNAQTGVWQPKAYSGSYGTNGFYLNFSDNSNTTAATLGKDYSGNGNNWTPNNFSVTAGAGNDSLVDSPTSYGTDTGVGGTVRGNYCTLNPLDNQLVLSNGNLQFNRSVASWVSSRATIGMTSGKWYWEVTATAATGTLYCMVGVSLNSCTLNDYFGVSSAGWGYSAHDGYKYNAGGLAYGSSWVVNDVIGIAFDADAGTITFYKNNVSQGTAYTGLTSGPYFPTVALNGTVTAYINFGQRPFAYTAPSGFKALCTQNLPTPTIGATTATQAGKYFNPVLYTGNGTARSITGVGFQPDWTWIKERSSTSGNTVTDSVRGTSKNLVTEITAAEGTSTNVLTSFNTDGFSLGTDGSINENSQTYVAWNWKANGAGSSNTAGSITSTVSANTTSGFSVVTWTSNGASGIETMGHGLGVAPAMIITKNRSAVSNWVTYHTSLGNNQYIALNTTAATSSFTPYWSTSSTTWGQRQSGIASNGDSVVAYCFAEVAGYSKFGSYTGNGSTDGPFVFTGMRPAYVLIKQTSSSGNNWFIYDTTRSTSNLTQQPLLANASDAELNSSSYGLDVLSNGFKIRTTDTNTNQNGQTYIFMALASNPFKYSLAR